MEHFHQDGRADAAPARVDDTHEYLVRGVTTDGDEGTQSAEAAFTPAAAIDPLASATEPEDEAATFRPLPLRAPTRRKINKTLQLTLLRKYVQCAKELDSVPDRATTEQLLDQAYDEFYFHGGDVNEPRMGYTAFVKLVRNRRGEALRSNRAGPDQQRRHHKKHANEIAEIQSLIVELERVRRKERQRGASQGMDTLASSQDSGTDRGDQSSAVPTTPIIISGEEHVLVPKHKLELILQSAQEMRETQAKLLAQVRALERELILRRHYPLGS